MGYKSRYHTNRVGFNWLKTYRLIELKTREWYIEDSAIDYSKYIRIYLFLYWFYTILFSKQFNIMHYLSVEDKSVNCQRIDQSSNDKQ